METCKSTQPQSRIRSHTFKLCSLTGVNRCGLCGITITRHFTWLSLPKAFLEPLSDATLLGCSPVSPTPQCTERLQVTILRLTKLLTGGFWAEQALLFRRCFILCFKFSTPRGKEEEEGRRGESREEEQVAILLPSALET